MVDKVTDPKKQVTDPVLLAHLAKHGVDKDYVEFVQDYAPAFVNGKKVKGQSPYSKHYRDLKSGKHFAVISGLPMCDKDGNKIEVGWTTDENGFTSKNNNFIAHVEGTQVTIIVRNDQPDGRKAGDRLTFNPQLFLDDKEQSCGKPTLLVVDPTNENYIENVLEWDYGICKRRLRIIESRVLGSWIFDKHPKKTVTIKYNQSGVFRLKFGPYRKDDDTEEINFDSFLVEPKFPFTLQDSPETFYPDAHTESTSVDGFCSTNDAGRTWALTRAAAGSYHLDTADGAAQTIVEFDSFNVSNQWYVIVRAFFLFDTSALPDTATITAATLSLYGRAKADPTSDTPTINIYASTPASNVDLVNSDFPNVGSTALCDTAITYAGWNNSGYNDFALNATGIAAISKTGVSKFGAREAKFDVAGTTPTYSSMASTYFAGYYAEKGTTYRPKLVVTYTTVTNTTVNSAVIIGNLVSASRRQGLTKNSTVIIGNKVTASRIRGIARSSAVIIGNVVTANRIYGGVRSAGIIFGNVITASKVGAFSRSVTVIVGNVVSASRVQALTMPSASVIIGNVVSASKVRDVARSTSVIIGNVVSASRIYGAVRNTSVIIGNVVSASKVGAFTRNASVTIGNVITASRIVGAVRSATITIGVKISATKSAKHIITATIKMGMKITATSTLVARVCVKTVKLMAQRSIYFVIRKRDAPSGTSKKDVEIGL